MFTGNVWKYGDDVNTDVIFPGRYTYLSLTEEEMGKYALEDLDLNFNKSDVTGNIIAAGKNFGCGSSREQAVKCIKARGIQAVVTKGFARIFYRNSLNEGLLVIVCPEAVDHINNGDEISIDMDRSVVITKNEIYSFERYPEFVQEMIAHGGLIKHVKSLVNK